MQAVRRRPRIWSPNGGSWSQAFLAWCVETGDKNAEATALALHEQQCDIQNAVFCEESLGNTRRRCRSFSERDGPRIILIENLPDKQISCSFSRDHKWAIYEFKLRKHGQKTNYDAETNNTDVEKSKNHRKQNLVDEANNMQLDKGDTQRSNLNSNYLSVTLCLKKYPDSFSWFYPASGKCFQKARYLAIWNYHRISTE